VTVTEVDPDSPAAEQGLKAGDKITAVNNQDVKSADDITKALAQASKDGRKKALFQIDADNGSRFIALPTEKG
jgi:serine protease Do